MIKILTWNICNKKTNLLATALAEIVKENKIDIAVFQEAYGKFITSILDIEYDEIPYPGGGTGSGVRIFLKRGLFKYFSIKRTDNKKLVLIHLITTKGGQEFNIAAVHLHSKVGNTERQQLWKNKTIIDEINEFEKNASNNSNTIIIGDFNNNPYEYNLSDPFLLNCKSSKNLITIFEDDPVSRKKKKNWNFWYNPMWNFLGDFDYATGHERATGTFFRYSEDETPMWNFFDGIILRPSLMHKLDYSESAIITKTYSINFLKRLIIRKDESLIKDDLSDHLPVQFALSIN